MNTTYDIIIVGGGMVGCALACALAQRTSLSIAVVEANANAQPWIASQYHHRVSAIALSSQRIFQSLQVWDAIENRRVSPFTQIQVWDAAGKGSIQFDSGKVDASVLGYIIENTAIQSALSEKLLEYSQITLLSPLNLASLQEKENCVELTSHDGCVISGRIVVAADGANSWVRAQAGIDLKKHDYQQRAIVATVLTALPHEQAARQVFLPSGPLAFLPLAQTNISSIVWSLPSDEAKRLQETDKEQFKRELASAFSHQLGAIVDVEQRYVFPLQRQQAKQYLKSRVVLAGDAAHTVHPLAGQGVNIGLLDAASLAEIIIDADKKQRDFAQYHVLRRYERWRKADNLAMLAGVHAIKYLFASDKKTVQGVRSLGLNTTNQLNWLKNIFIRHAIGDRGGLPQLAS